MDYTNSQKSALQSVLSVDVVASWLLRILACHVSVELGRHVDYTNSQKSALQSVLSVDLVASWLLRILACHVSVELGRHVDLKRFEDWWKISKVSFLPNLLCKLTRELTLRISTTRRFEGPRRLAILKIQVANKFTMQTDRGVDFWELWWRVGVGSKTRGSYLRHSVTNHRMPEVAGLFLQKSH